MMYLDFPHINQQYALNFMNHYQHFRMTKYGKCLLYNTKYYAGSFQNTISIFA